MAKFPPLTLKKVIFDTPVDNAVVIRTFSIDPVFESTQLPCSPNIVKAFDTFRERFEMVKV